MMSELLLPCVAARNNPNYLSINDRYYDDDERFVLSAALILSLFSPLRPLTTSTSKVANTVTNYIIIIIATIQSNGSIKYRL